MDAADTDDKTENQNQDTALGTERNPAQKELDEEPPDSL